MKRFKVRKMIFVKDDGTEIQCKKLYAINTNNAWGFGGYIGARYEALDKSVSFDWNKQCGRRSQSEYYISNIVWEE